MQLSGDACPFSLLSLSNLTQTSVGGLADLAVRAQFFRQYQVPPGVTSIDDLHSDVNRGGLSFPGSEYPPTDAGVCASLWVHRS